MDRFLISLHRYGAPRDGYGAPPDGGQGPRNRYGEATDASREALDRSIARPEAYYPFLHGARKRDLAQKRSW